MGSSPRMRGTQARRIHRHHRHGIIPAHAGEHRMSIVSTAPLVGSSPRMRGTLGLRLGRVPVLGIIPAHAGNTGHRKSTTAWTRDHPRACGEHRTSCLVPDTNQGSSPRMRGTPDLFRALAVGEGIIPAHAGNTRWWPAARSGPGDHPRACGEHVTASSAGCYSRGSSPRMRGTHSPRLVLTVGQGIIPAHAGNTRLRLHRLKTPRDHPRACGEHDDAGTA